MPSRGRRMGRLMAKDSGSTPAVGAASARSNLGPTGSDIKYTTRTVHSEDLIVRGTGYEREVEPADDGREQHTHLHLGKVHAEALPRGVREGQEALRARVAGLEALPSEK